ncbi:MAG: Holliday junction DNA helicase RuvA [Candidatus Melainabacteria bacterium GWA2_34_9]|nr:MAG: Holliday junction DNA helicase RuvA [Candidatus Melainabacteria bacterium GWA2_34_9]
MINYLKGTLISKVEDGPFGCNITVEVNNIGYIITTNKKVVSLLPEEGNIVTIYTSLIHREDNMSLCGFNTREDRDLFNILQSVSGIGVKVALLLLGELGAYRLVSAVISGDAKALSKTKGVGPKIAQRIILELKDKMTNWREKVVLKPSEITKIDDIEINQSYIEAETVLLSLGYTKKESAESLKNTLPLAKNKEDSEELLQLSLQWLVSKEG